MTAEPKNGSSGPVLDVYGGKSIFRKAVNKIKLVQRGFSPIKELGISGRKTRLTEQGTSSNVSNEETQQQKEQDRRSYSGYPRLSGFSRRSTAGNTNSLQGEISNTLQSYFQ